MPQAIILRGARIIDPGNGTDAVRDLGIADGLLVAPETIPHATIVPLPGYVVAPGFIDLHVHLREPGQTQKEDIGSGTRAAAAGGFTTVVAMPNTTPAVDGVDILAAVQARIRETAVCRVLQTAAITLGRKGTVLTDARALAAAGAIALTDDGTTLANPALMREALVQARAAGLSVIDHCEERLLADGGVFHAGPAAASMGIKGIPASAEELIVARDILLAGETGARVHLQHLSSGLSVDLLRWARARGFAVTGEVTPHHLCLTEQACLEQGSNAKMNPPLRTEADRQALLAGLQDGTIAAIATDHAPHTQAEKALPLAEAPFGIVGLESAIPLCFTQLFHTGRLTLPRLIALFTSGPRQILNLAGGTLTPGSPADLTVLDLNREVVIDPTSSQSRSRNTPFAGWRCQGRAAATIIGGWWVYCVAPGVISSVPQENRRLFG